MQTPDRNRRKQSPRSPAHGNSQSQQNVRECACGRGLACVGMTQAFRMLGDPRCYYVELPRYRKDPPAYKYVFRNNLRAAYLRHLAKQNPDFNAAEFDSSKRRYVALHHFHPTVVRAFYENPLTAAQKHRVPVSITEHEMKQLEIECNEEDRILSMTGKPTGGYFFVPDYPQTKAHGDLKALIKAERQARDFRAKLHQVARERKQEKQQQAQTTPDFKPTATASRTGGATPEESKEVATEDIGSSRSGDRSQRASVKSSRPKSVEVTKDPDYSSSDEVDVKEIDQMKSDDAILGSDDLDVGVSDEVAASFDDIWNEGTTTTSLKVETKSEPDLEDDTPEPTSKANDDELDNPLMKEESEAPPTSEKVLDVEGDIATPTETSPARQVDKPDGDIITRTETSPTDEKVGDREGDEVATSVVDTESENLYPVDTESEADNLFPVDTESEKDMVPEPSESSGIGDEEKAGDNEEIHSQDDEARMVSSEAEEMSSGETSHMLPTGNNTVDSEGPMAFSGEERNDDGMMIPFVGDIDETAYDSEPSKRAKVPSSNEVGSSVNTEAVVKGEASIEDTSGKDVEGLYAVKDVDPILVSSSQEDPRMNGGDTKASETSPFPESSVPIDDAISSTNATSIEDEKVLPEGSQPLGDAEAVLNVEAQNLAIDIAQGDETTTSEGNKNNANPSEAVVAVETQETTVDALVVGSQDASTNMYKTKPDLAIDTSPQHDMEGGFDRPALEEEAQKGNAAEFSGEETNSADTGMVTTTDGSARLVDAGKEPKYLATPSTLERVVSGEQFLGVNPKPLDIECDNEGGGLISPLNTPAGMSVITESYQEDKDATERSDTDDNHLSLPNISVDRSIFKERSASVADISKSHALDPPGKTVSFSASQDEEDITPAESSPTAEGAISLSHQLPGADPTIRIQVHNDLIAWESKRRSNLSASLETMREEWKGAREILRDGVEELLVAERLVMGFSKAGVLFADSIKAMCEDKMLDNQGNTVTNTFLQNRLMNKRRTQEYSIENASSSAAGQGQTGQSSLLNSVVDSQRQLAQAFIESARHMEAEVLLEATEMRAEGQARANELEAIGESILGEMKRSEMEVKKIWDVFDAMVTGDLMEYSTHGSMHGSFHGSLHGSNHSYGGSSLHGFLNPESPVVSHASTPMVKTTFKQLGGVEDGWLIEMYYRAAVTYQRSVFSIGENELKNLYKQIVKLEEKRQRRLHEVMLAFVPKQRRLMLGLPEHLNEMLENLVGLRIDEESLQSLIDESIQERSHTHLKSSFQHKSSIMNRSRLQKDKGATEIEDIEAEFGNPFESSMVRDSRVVELKPGGLGGIVNTNWKPALSVVTSDGNMHIFELPATGGTPATSLEAFRSLYPSMAFDNSLGWVQGRKNDIVRGVTPYQTLFVGRCKMTISNMRKRQFDIVEEGGESSGRLGGNRLLNAASAQLQKCTMRLPSASDTAEWVAFLINAKEKFAGRPGMTKSQSVARKSSRFLNF